MRLIAALVGTFLMLPGLTPSSATAQNFSGTGQQATALFSMDGGLAVFEMEHEGEGRFLVRLLNEQGVPVDMLADGTGAFQGSKAVRLPQAGRYLFDVTASGRWAIRLRDSDPSAPVAEGAVSDSVLRSRGRYYGAQEANRIGGLPYMLGALVGGVAAGPIGAGAAFAIASSREPNLPAQTRDSLAMREPAYSEAFSEAFRSRLRANRRTSALVGGATGTAVFLFVVAQVVNWGESSGNTVNPPGGEQP